MVWGPLKHVPEPSIGGQPINRELEMLWLMGIILDKEICETMEVKMKSAMTTCVKGVEISQPEDLFNKMHRRLESTAA